MGTRASQAKIILTLSNQEGTVDQCFDAPDDPLLAAQTACDIIAGPPYGGPNPTDDVIVGFRWARRHERP